MNLKLLALLFAKSQVGEQESPKGSNKGPMVDIYLKTVGLNPGFAWCMAFVYWNYAMAAKALGITNPLVRNASVLSTWAKTLPANLILAKDVIANPALIGPGDIAIWRHGNATGHTAIVEAVKMETMTFQTIEGNTNVDGSREGYRVERKERKLNDPQLLGFIKFS